MNATPMPMLACGPGADLFYVIYGGGALCLLSFILGLVFLILDLKGLGLGLICFSAGLTATILVSFRIL